MTTAAKMVLHDWQRGKIPFFVPPPKQQDEPSTEPDTSGIDEDTAEGSDKASAAFKAIANVISSQQQMTVPVQRDLFSETELKGETAEQCLTSTSSQHQMTVPENETESKSETNEQLPIGAEDETTQQLSATQSKLDDQLPVTDS